MPYHGLRRDRKARSVPSTTHRPTSQRCPSEPKRTVPELHDENDRDTATAKTSNVHPCESSTQEESALLRVVKEVKQQVETDRKQREDLDGLQQGIDQLRQRNYENEQTLQYLLSLRTLQAFSFLPYQVRI